jgi:hypothetical protein
MIRASLPAGRRPGPGEAPAVLDFEPAAFLIGVYKNLLISIWHRQATRPELERMAKGVQDVARSHPEGFSEMHVVAEGIGIPDRKAVNAYVDLIAQVNPPVCISVVLGGTGFVVSTLRSVVTGLSFAFRRGSLGLHADVREAARWLAIQHPKRTGVAIDASQLVMVANGWRGQLE